jgi:hypothetical protein
LQLLGLFLVFVVLIALVAGFYLSVSAEAAAIGREIQEMQEDIRELEQENENLKSILGNLTSARNLRDRADDMNYQPIDSEEATYLRVPGYPGRPPVSLAPARQVEIISAPILPDSYTESLIEWLYRKFSPYIIPILERQP